MSEPRTLASLRLRLKGFQAPDTRSDFEGHLDPGKYLVLEYRENFPDADMDYALLVAPFLGAGDTWICTRWKQERYADVFTAPAPTPAAETGFEDFELVVPESGLVDLLPSFHDFTYDIDEARYPFELPGVRVPIAPPLLNNCCTFVEALLVGAWRNVHPDEFVWSAERHRQMMIISSDDFFSPVTAAIESGTARAVEDSDQLPQPWTIVQGWRHQWRGGHTFIIVDHDPTTDRVLTLESNSAFNLDGVGFRELGNLRDFPDGKPPENWWERDGLWTWEEVCAKYRFRRQALLKVTDRTWSRGSTG